MDQILTALQAGGNVAMIAIAAALWRMDRRLLSVELRLTHHLKEHKA